MADLKDVFDRVSVAIAPVAYGGGIKGKVIDSLAAGVPCVSTPIAAEGVSLPAALRTCITADADAIANTVVRIHNDEVDNERNGKVGIAFVAETFSEDQLDSLFKAISGPVFS